MALTREQLAGMSDGRWPDVDLSSPAEQVALAELAEAPARGEIAELPAWQRERRDEARQAEQQPREQAAAADTDGAGDAAADVAVWVAAAAESARWTAMMRKEKERMAGERGRLRQAEEAARLSAQQRHDEQGAPATAVEPAEENGADEVEQRRIQWLRLESEHEHRL